MKQQTSVAPRRGSVEAVLQALEQVGPLQFAPGELDTLLAEIQTMREMDFKPTPVEAEPVSDWDARWDALARKVSQTWKGDQSAVEIWGEMR